MTTEFDDELLSAVLDGEADPQTVAAVQADPEAAKRLAGLEAAAALVATPPAPATPERRAASIAAALAAAQPAPEVSSLSVARERKATAAAPKRRHVNWLAIAAAFAFVLISAVVITSIVGGGGSESFDTATDAADASDDAVEDVAEAAEESFSADGATMAESAATNDAELAMEDDAMEEAMEEEEAMEDEAMEAEDSDGETAATTTTVTSERSTEPFATNNLLLLEEAVDLGTVVPLLRPTDPELLDVVNSECLNPELPPDIDQFAFAELGEFAPPPQLVVVQFDPFDPSQVILIFDAEDCTPVG